VVVRRMSFHSPLCEGFPPFPSAWMAGLQILHRALAGFHTWRPGKGPERLPL